MVTAILMIEHMKAMHGKSIEMTTAMCILQDLLINTDVDENVTIYQRPIHDSVRSHIGTIIGQLECTKCSYKTKKAWDETLP